MDQKSENELVETVEQRNADHVRRLLAVPGVKAMLERGGLRRKSMPTEAEEVRR